MQKQLQEKANPMKENQTNPTTCTTRSEGKVPLSTQIMNVPKEKSKAHKKPTRDIVRTTRSSAVQNKG